MVRSIFLRCSAFFAGLMPLLVVVSWFLGVLKDMHPVVFAASSHMSTPHVVQSSSVSRVPQHLGEYGGSSMVVGSPSISAVFLEQVLEAYHSAAVGEGEHIYDDGVAVNIDPVFALAFFMHESSFGLAGEARESLNPGNLRCLPDVKCQDNFAWFSSWSQGFQAWYRLIRNVYVDGWHAITVEQIIPHYAPSSDHNNESGYIAAVMHAVGIWRSGQVFV